MELRRKPSCRRGVGIAAADGQIDDIELGRLTSHLEAQFDLSTQDSARLEHLRYLLTKQPPIEFSAAKKLQKTLSLKQRKLVGEFLVGIAAADEQIAPEEVKALGKAYRALADKNTRHEHVNHSQHEYVRGDVHTNGIESAWSLFKRSIVGSYHQLSEKHLDAYLDEFEWRFNNRDNDFLFHDTLRALLSAQTLPYSELVAED